VALFGLAASSLKALSGEDARFAFYSILTKTLVAFAESKDWSNRISALFKVFWRYKCPVDYNFIQVQCRIPAHFGKYRFFYVSINNFNDDHFRSKCNILKSAADFLCSNSGDGFIFSKRFILDMLLELSLMGEGSWQSPFYCISIRAFNRLKFTKDRLLLSRMIASNLDEYAFILRDNFRDRTIGKSAMQLLSIFTHPDEFDIRKEDIYNALRNNRIFKSLIMILKNHEIVILLPQTSQPQPDCLIDGSSTENTPAKRDSLCIQILDLILSFADFPSFLDSDDFSHLVSVVLKSNYFADKICYIPHCLKLVKRADQAKAIENLIRSSLQLISTDDMRGFSILYTYFKLKRFLIDSNNSFQIHDEFSSDTTSDERLILNCYPAVDFSIEYTIRQINNRTSRYFELKLRNLRQKYADGDSERVVMNQSKADIKNNPLYSPHLKSPQQFLMNVLRSEIIDEYLVCKSEAIEAQSNKRFLEKWIIKGRTV
jgi:hypothetical protein